jgi:hypothetical protein
MPNASGSNVTRNIGFDVTKTDGKVRVKGKMTRYSYLGDWTYLTPEESGGNGRIRHYIDAKTGLTSAEENLLKQIPTAISAAKEEKINQLNRLLILKTPTRFYDKARNKIYDSSVLYGYDLCRKLVEHGLLKDSNGNPLTTCPGSSNSDTNTSGSTTPQAIPGGGRRTRRMRKMRKMRKMKSKSRKSRR